MKLAERAEDKLQNLQVNKYKQDHGIYMCIVYYTEISSMRVKIGEVKIQNIMMRQ